MLYYGVVENRQDPLELGRCQTRIVGVHTHDKSVLPTSELPWAYSVTPVTSAAMNGIGSSPVGPVEGTTVMVMFADGDRQNPIIVGTLGGISNRPLPIAADPDSLPASVPIEDVVLRTVPGPTSGNQLTFFDPDGILTNLTGPLRPNMRLDGYNLPDDTFIVSIDSGTSITINNPVLEYGENIITFTQPPINSEALILSQIARTTPVAPAGEVVPQAGTEIRTVPTESDIADPPASSPTNNDIPQVPPPSFRGDQNRAIEGIRALISACDQVGLTTKEQKATVLGIVGGESRWVPQQEAYNYSLSRIRQVYRFASEADAQAYSRAPSKNITREQFFSWAYGPTQRGANFLGNRTDADGGAFYGRGFIQLTGRSNYERYNRMAQEMGLNIDIVNNPETLNSDINVSALITALYFKDRVPSQVSPTDHPGYFYAGKRAVGYNTDDIARIKREYYEYFYGAVAPDAPVRTAGTPPIPTPVATGDAAQTGTFQAGPSATSIETGSLGTGFRDPNNKYPLEEFLNEPDTNRLARGVIENTIVPKKIALREAERGHPKGVVGGSWDMPEIPFGAKYPYNHVMETESGHIQEWDDTPGQERTQTWHRSGTYSEVDPNGTQVNYIVGDAFWIMERNGSIHINGECNVNIDGDANIYARSDANVQVANNATIQVGNNLDVGVHNDMKMNVGGNFNMQVDGNWTSTVKGDVNHKVEGAWYNEATNQFSVKSNGMYLNSTSTLDILSDGETNFDYSIGNFGMGASGATAVPSLEFTRTPADTPLEKRFDFLQPPERDFEELVKAETPDEFNTPEGRRDTFEMRQSGNPDAPPPVAEEAAPNPTGGIPLDQVASCDVIQGVEDFGNDFVVSPNFNLGMMIDGGVNGKNTLQSQMVKNTRNGPDIFMTKQEIVCNMANLAQNLLEPALGVLPDGISGYNSRWRINSGFRATSRGIGSPSSDHNKGCAVDLGVLVDGGLTERINQTYELVQQLERVIPYNQLILEYRNSNGRVSVWIHAALKPTGNRGQAFTMVNDRTYGQGFHLVTNVPPKRS